MPYKLRDRENLANFHGQPGHGAKGLLNKLEIWEFEMKKLMISVAALSLISVGTAFAAGNVSIVNQGGWGNSQFTGQAGFGNLAVTQQGGIANNSATGQMGAFNYSGTSQNGIANTSVTGQLGFGNMSETYQGSIGNYSNTTQVGVGNQSLTVQN
ncbi:MAG: hypothetical protein Q8P60_14085 [Pseudorhodobacter sp.]|nr:hypothetical protein [Pseudorhodobacter sp.]